MNVDLHGVYKEHVYVHYICFPVAEVIFTAHHDDHIIKLPRTAPVPTFSIILLLFFRHNFPNTRGRVGHGLTRYY